MNKIHAILLITLISLSICSCKKDSAVKDTPTETTTIVGEWRTDYRTFEFYANGKLIDTQTENSAANSSDYLSLKADGTGSIKASGEARIKFTYTSTNTAINFTNVTSLLNDNWVSNKDYGYTIIKLKGNELIYSTEGPVASPAPYDKYVTRIHAAK